MDRYFKTYCGEPVTVFLCWSTSRDDIERMLTKQTVQDADDRDAVEAALNLTPKVLPKVPNEWVPSRPASKKAGIK